jgi:hypothetical protein
MPLTAHPLPETNILKTASPAELSALHAGRPAPRQTPWRYDGRENYDRV